MPGTLGHYSGSVLRACAGHLCIFDYEFMRREYTQKRLRLTTNHLCRNLGLPEQEKKNSFETGSLYADHIDSPRMRHPAREEPSEHWSLETKAGEN